MEQCSTEGTRVVCLCFRTEEQARNLLTFAALFAQSPEISYELVHSPGRDGSPAGRLAPWLEGLRHDFEDAASAERVRLRDVSRNYREASFDIALGAPWLILVSTDDHDRSADRFARSLFLEPSATSLLVHGRVNAPPRRMLMPAEGLAEETDSETLSSFCDRQRLTSERWALPPSITTRHPSTSSNLT